MATPLSLKDKSGNTVTAAVVTSSAGDKSPAKWRIEDTTKPPLYRTTVEVTARSNPNGTVRRIGLRVEAPYVVTSGSSTPLVPVARPLFSGEFVVDQQVPTDEVQNLVAYVTSAMGTAALTSAFVAQIAP